MTPSLTRLPDWRARFAAEMDRQRRDPFAWGSQDCALGLAAGAVEAITGQDVAARWRGRYRSPSGARRALHKAGFTSLADLVASLLPEIAPAFANVGDIGLIEADGPLRQALCVVDASGLIVLTEAGHGRRPRHDMIRAFKVG
ncbi:DUF6950 family protein [Paracoccus kondratievae]|uniref:DUF6950 domain-containing protein n=1 Tax=Paracoccus kondratievae TaxID=135740 RepID=A0AAD3NY14_9RHOB|nr:hypothetical protein [Paracoccus kondratievae]AZV00293.1 hypothetical protein pkon1_p64 [Paracoccus phage vB_PkoS_Pkon1]GLK63455.1 hypothetical protein GCM10017635_09250 [Paracoccus kondratievae]